MNLSGISGSTSTVTHFWVIAIPVTIGIVILCSVVAFKGEDVFLMFARSSRRLKELHVDRVSVGNDNDFDAANGSNAQLMDE